MHSPTPPLPAPARTLMPTLRPRPVRSVRGDAPRVVLDIDGTLADYVGSLRRHLGRELGLTAAQTLERFPATSNYDFPEWGLDRDAYTAAHHRAITQGRLLLTLPALPGAVRAAHALDAAGCWNVILTHRFVLHGTSAATVKDTVDWLDTVVDPADPDGPVGIPYREFCVSGEKDLVATGADLVVEDSPSNIAKLEAAGFTVITMAQPYNVGVGAHRAENWDVAIDMASDLLDVDLVGHYATAA